VSGYSLSKNMAYQRPTPTADELLQGANHLLYEVLMLSNTAAVIEDDSQWNTGWGWAEQTLYLSSVETFLTHARSLMDFVCPPSDYETRPVHERGIFAADYCREALEAPTVADTAAGTQADQHRDRAPELRSAACRPQLAVCRHAEQTSGHARDLVNEADELSAHIKDQLLGCSFAVFGSASRTQACRAMAISTASITGTIGMSGATTGMIDPAQVEQ